MMLAGNARRWQFVPAAMIVVAWAILAARAEAAPFVPERVAQSAAFSVDGRLAATGKSGLSNSEFPPRPHPTPAKCAVVHVWDVASGKIVKRMETYGDIIDVQFSKDSKLVASARLFKTVDGVPMNEVCLWDIATGKPRHRFDRCHTFAFSADGKSIAVLSRLKCALYDLKTLKKTALIEPLGGAISLSASPAGNFLVGVVPEEDKFVIRLCDGKGTLVAQSAPLHEPFYTLAFSHDGQTLASGHDAGNVLLWNAEDLQAIARFNAGTGELQHPFFSPDGAILGSGSQTKGDVVFWNLSSRKEVRRFTYKRGTFRTYYSRNAKNLVRPERDPHRFAFSPDGSSFIAGCYGGIIRLLASGQEVRRFAE